MARQGDQSMDIPCITGPGVKDPEAMQADAKTALEWAEKYVEDHESPFSVKIKWNPHDFGSYPSLEIYYDLDKPHSFDDECSDGKCDECVPYSKMLDDVEKFDEAYSEKFKEWL